MKGNKILSKIKLFFERLWEMTIGRMISFAFQHLLEKEYVEKILKESISKNTSKERKADGERVHMPLNKEQEIGKNQLNNLEKNAILNQNVDAIFSSLQINPQIKIRVDKEEEYDIELFNLQDMKNIQIKFNGISIFRIDNIEENKEQIAEIKEILQNELKNNLPIFSNVPYNEQEITNQIKLINKSFENMNEISIKNPDKKFLQIQTEHVALTGKKEKIVLSKEAFMEFTNSCIYDKNKYHSVCNIYFSLDSQVHTLKETILQQDHEGNHIWKNIGSMEEVERIINNIQEMDKEKMIPLKELISKYNTEIKDPIVISEKVLER